MAAPSNPKKSVWIIDDDPIARLLINKTIERTGMFAYSREFADGSEFIQEIGKMGKNGFDEPDLILLDINMPIKNGWDVLEHIKVESISFKKSRLALLTSSINPKDRKKAFCYDSVSGFLKKPLTQENLESLNL